MIDYGVCMGMLKGVRSQLYTIWTRHGPYKPVAGLEVESHFKYAKKKEKRINYDIATCENDSGTSVTSS